MIGGGGGGGGWGGGYNDFQGSDSTTIKFKCGSDGGRVMGM